MGDLRHQLSELATGEVLVSGRHGDFGPWNILVGPQGVTVLDFLGYDEEPLAVDPLKMLMTFEDEKRSPGCSPPRISALRKMFLEGYGHLPPATRPVLVICETLHRVYSVLTCLSDRGRRFPEQIQKRLCLKANIAWLTSEGPRGLLWPGSSIEPSPLD